MRSLIILLLINFQLLSTSYGQEINLDAVINTALAHSEKALYEGRLAEAKDMVAIEQFRDNEGFKINHEILLTIRKIRIERFKRNLYLKQPDVEAHLLQLKLILPDSDEVKDENILGRYYHTLAQAFGSVGKTDSARFYKEKAKAYFLRSDNFEEIAGIRASEISQKHVELLSAGDTLSVYELIPGYREEIAYSQKYSQYSLAYNTRHLAQIYLKLDLDYNESLRLFEISKNIREEIGFKIFLPASYSSLGEVYLKLNDDEEAIYWYTKAVELAQEIGFIRYESYPVLMIGDIYLKQGMVEEAGIHYSKARQTALENNYTIGIEQAEERLDKMKGSRD
jgi:tetratricopeptide (TPR) repeat protein